MENEKKFVQIFTFELFNENPLLDTQSEIKLDSFLEVPLRLIEDCKNLPTIYKLDPHETFDIPECKKIANEINMIRIRTHVNMYCGPYMFKTNSSLSRNELELYLNHESRDVLNSKLKGARL